MARKTGKKGRGEGSAPQAATRAAWAAPGGKRAQPKASASSRSLPRTWFGPVAFATLGGLLLGATMILLSLSSVAASAPAVAGVRHEASSGDPRSLGIAEAPVVIIEWADFQCPACRSFALSREPELLRLYVDIGKVRLESRDFAFLGPESFLAAEAARAAADQGRYWDYRNLLFSRQRGENTGAFSTDNLKRFASELGLDRKAFDDSLDRGSHRSEVRAEVKQGESLGVKATPTLFVNGRKIEGVPSMDALRRMIDEELAKTKS